MHNPVRDILKVKGSQVHTIAPEATVLQAVATMNEHRVGALVVVAEDLPVGIFSERDVLVRVVLACCDLRRTLVSEVMTRGISSIAPTTRVEDAMRIMTDRRRRHLPVVDNGALVGMITIGDLVRWNIRDGETRINDLVGYITGR